MFCISTFIFFLNLMFIIFLLPKNKKRQKTVKLILLKKKLQSLNLSSLLSLLLLWG